MVSERLIRKNVFVHKKRRMTNKLICVMKRRREKMTQWRMLIFCWHGLECDQCQWNFVWCCSPAVNIFASKDFVLLPKICKTHSIGYQPQKSMTHWMGHEKELTKKKKTKNCVDESNVNILCFVMCGSVTNSFIWIGVVSKFNTFVSSTKKNVITRSRLNSIDCTRSQFVFV